MKRLILIAAVAGLAACTTAEPATPQEVAFTATDFAFTGPDTIAPGVTTVMLENHGASTHHMMMALFADGYGVQDLMAFVDSNPNGIPPFLTWRGAAGAVSPGSATGMTADLPAGHYVLLCFVAGEDGVPHMMKGMMREVVATGTRHEAPMPAADGVIHSRDFAFDIPATMTAGTHTFHFINDGPQTHELQLIRLHDGATLDEVFAAVAPGAAGPPPMDEVGGPGALSMGLDNYWTVTLEPGNYALLCFVPDVADGAPHVMKGMVQAFTVPAS